MGSENYEITLKLSELNTCERLLDEISRVMNDAVIAFSEAEVERLREYYTYEITDLGEIVTDAETISDKCIHLGNLLRLYTKLCDEIKNEFMNEIEGMTNDKISISRARYEQAFGNLNSVGIPGRPSSTSSSNQNSSESNSKNNNSSSTGSDEDDSGSSSFYAPRSSTDIRSKISKGGTTSKVTQSTRSKIVAKKKKH